MLHQWKKTILTLSLVLISFFVLGDQTHAQGFQLYSSDDIIAETIPRIPGPNESVTINLTSYSFNINNYYIAWFQDGERTAAGFGLRDFTFTTGDSGSLTRVSAVVEFNDQILRKELQFSPSTVDLLWEANDAYVPPFYKGKALPIAQSQIKITAIPETLLIEPTDAPNLIYYWDRNYSRDQAGSGFGKQSFEIELDPLLEEEILTLTVNDRRENSSSQNTLRLPSNEFEPRILFYEIDDNGRLMTQRALNTNNTIEKDTIRLSFHPLFMSSNRLNFTDMFVNWSLNNTSQPPQDFGKQNELYITSNGTSGSTAIGLNLEGIDKLLQKAQENFNIRFSLS